MSLHSFVGINIDVFKNKKKINFGLKLQIIIIQNDFKLEKKLSIDFT